MEFADPFINYTPFIPPSFDNPALQLSLFETEEPVGLFYTQEWHPSTYDAQETACIDSGQVVAQAEKCELVKQKVDQVLNRNEAYSFTEEKVISRNNKWENALNPPHELFYQLSVGKVVRYKSPRGYPPLDVFAPISKKKRWKNSATWQPSYSSYDGPGDEKTSGLPVSAEGYYTTRSVKYQFRNRMRQRMSENMRKFDIKKIRVCDTCQSRKIPAMLELKKGELCKRCRNAIKITKKKIAES